MAETKNKHAGGRPPKFTPESMAKQWEAYKLHCNSRTITKTEFSAKLGQFFTQEIPAYVTYTIEGFCIYAGISVASFYATYADDDAALHDEFAELVTRIREECRQDAREKFELGVIPSQLSGLWMSRYGYSTKQETEVKGGIPVVISGEDDLQD